MRNQNETTQRIALNIPGAPKLFQWRCVGIQKKAGTLLSPKSWKILTWPTKTRTVVRSGTFSKHKSGKFLTVPKQART